jgi:inward rectifier potassium channel
VTDVFNSLPQPRIVPRNRAERIRRRNIRDRWYHDLYHRALTLPWYLFLVVGCAVYLIVNVGFAGLYLLQPGAITGAKPGFWDAFFFSIQTIATIGYGQMYPATFYCNALVTLETMTGLVFVALATGITFARISRPTARVMFARVATVTRYNSVPTLQIRIANERISQILEADVAVSLLRYERTAEGHTMRRFYDLVLLRPHTPVFALSFTIMHTIDERSPLYGLMSDDLVGSRAELLVTVTGLEEMTSQTVHARHAYQPEEILFGRRYRDIFTTDEQGVFIDYATFHETETTSP